MNIINPSWKIISSLNREEILQDIELYGRTCYKSEDKITKESSSKFVKMISGKGHLSVFEHKNITVRFIHNRGFLSELSRHRLISLSVESTRYVAYDKDKCNNEITFIKPYWVSNSDNLESYNNWLSCMHTCEIIYMRLRKQGLPAEAARGVLPNDTKTEIIITANLREWQHIFNLRCDKSAHPDMRRVMIPLRDYLIEILPEVFSFRE